MLLALEYQEARNVGGAAAMIAIELRLSSSAIRADLRDVKFL